MVNKKTHFLHGFVKIKTAKKKKLDQYPDYFLKISFHYALLERTFSMIRKVLEILI